VTAPPNQARCRPLRQPVSSRYAPGWACPEARASATGAATAWAVACSRCAMVPHPLATPHRAALTCWGVRFDTCYAPAHSAVIACTRGPKPPAGTLAGTAGRIASPHAGQTKRCR
jgi:hypothetical protein